MKYILLAIALVLSCVTSAHSQRLLPPRLQAVEGRYRTVALSTDLPNLANMLEGEKVIVLRHNGGQTFGDCEPFVVVYTGAGPTVDNVFTFDGPGAGTERFIKADQSKVDVMQAGAIGDGVNDDSQEILAAMTAMSAKGGGKVVFPKKTFEHNFQGIAIPGNLTLEGNGAVIENAFWAFNSPNCVCSNFTFRRTGDTLIGGTDYHGIQAVTTDHHIFTDLRFAYTGTTTSGSAFRISGARHIKIDRCYFGPDAGAMGVANYGRDIQISNCEFDYAQNDDAIVFKSVTNTDSGSSSNWTISNCIVRGASGMISIGSECAGYIRNITITNVTGEDCNSLLLCKNGIEATPDEYLGGTIENVTLNGFSFRQTRMTESGHCRVDDSGAFTNEDTPWSDATADDVEVFVSPTTNDAIYFGHATTRFKYIVFNLTTPAVGSFAITWEYWDGSTWNNMADNGLSDGSTSFTAVAGWKQVNFGTLSGWTPTTVNSVSAYWIRARLSTFTSMSTLPQIGQGGLQVVSHGSGPLIWISCRKNGLVQNINVGNGTVEPRVRQHEPQLAAFLFMQGYDNSGFTNTIRGVSIHDIDCRDPRGGAIDTAFLHGKMVPLGLRFEESTPDAGATVFDNVNLYNLRIKDLGGSFLNKGYWPAGSAFTITRLKMRNIHLDNPSTDPISNDYIRSIDVFHDAGIEEFTGLKVDNASTETRLPGPVSTDQENVSGGTPSGDAPSITTPGYMKVEEMHMDSDESDIASASPVIFRYRIPTRRYIARYEFISKGFPSDGANNNVYIVRKDVSGAKTSITSIGIQAYSAFTSGVRYATANGLLSPTDVAGADVTFLADAGTAPFSTTSALKGEKSIYNAGDYMEVWRADNGIGQLENSLRLRIYYLEY